MILFEANACIVELKSYSPVAHHHTTQPVPQGGGGGPAPQGQTAGEVAVSHGTALNGSPGPTAPHSQGSPASVQQHYTTYTSAASYSYPTSSGKKQS